MKIPLKKIWKTASKFTIQHSPEILTGIGIAGMISSIAMAVKATPSAQHHIGEAIVEKDGQDLTPVETVKAVWRDYLPTAIMTGLSAGCLIGSVSVSTRRTAALATAYQLSENALSEYMDKVRETIGEKKEREIQEKTAIEKMRKSNASEAAVIDTGRGTTWCFDTISARYFKSDIEDIRQVVNRLNFRLNQGEFVSLNDFYYEIGLRGVKFGDDIGWDSECGLVDFKYGADFLEDGKTPCLSIDLNIRGTIYHY